jgi:hypothetical protein
MLIFRNLLIQIITDILKRYHGPNRWDTVRCEKFIEAFAALLSNLSPEQMQKIQSLIIKRFSAWFQDIHFVLAISAMTYWDKLIQLFPWLHADEAILNALKANQKHWSG